MNDNELMELCGSIAVLWESRQERVADVANQVREIHDKLVEWGWTEVDREELDNATICYSRACAVHECCQWLPFDVMPNWEEDLYCLLMDEDKWEACMDANGDACELAKVMRKAAR